MTTANKSRAWFFPTSPRSPHKIQGELRLLKSLEGSPWNEHTQIRFADLLRDSDDFFGSISKHDPAFSARDRASRAPKLLGFVHLPKRGARGDLQFTEVGNAFLEASVDEQPLIFQRQIAKVQFSSPLHSSGGFELMSIRPLMLMIRLVAELKTMSKEEIALFGLTVINHRHIPERIACIQQYRSELSQMDVNTRKEHRKSYAENWIRKIYRQDIRLGNIKLREGGDDFVKTKYDTLRDYSDSTIRYLRATGLFTVSPHGQRLTLINSSRPDADFLLAKYGCGPFKTQIVDYDSYVREYLGNPSLPEIWKDDEIRQSSDVKRMVNLLSDSDPEIAADLHNNYVYANTRLDALKSIGLLERHLTTVQVQNEAKSIKAGLTNSLDDIRLMFKTITDRKSDVLDRPLMYEWNAWRSMVLINDAKNVIGYFRSDADGNPVTVAGGKSPDILVEYASFWLTVEVTLSRGSRQFETEGESISRHLGELQRTLIDSGDPRPAFGIFVAEDVNDTIIGHLRALSRYRNDWAKGSIRIIPMNRLQFEGLAAATVGQSDFDHTKLFAMFTKAFSKDALELGDADWLALVAQFIERMLTNG